MTEHELFAAWLARDIDVATPIGPRDAWLACAAQKDEKIKELEAKNESLRKDAERYRAIPTLDNIYFGPEYSTYNDVIVDGDVYYNFGATKETMDAAIDEAMKELEKL